MLIRVYICQNTTLLEITCCGSNMVLSYCLPLSGNEDSCDEHIFQPRKNSILTLKVPRKNASENVC